MSNKTIFQEKNARLNANNIDLTSILETINNLPSAGSSGGTDELDALVTRTITSYSNNTIKSIPAYAFHGCSKLITVRIPAATSLLTSAFNGCSNMISIEIPLVQSITTQTFYACHSLENLIMPSLKTIGAQGVRNCNKLTTVDVGVCTSIGALSFENCPKLNTVIIRTSSVCSLANVSAFTGTPIANGTGYIYVPGGLVNSYKTATNWSTYANQIRSIATLEEPEPY